VLFLRVLISFLILPGTFAGLMPAWTAHEGEILVRQCADAGPQSGSGAFSDEWRQTGMTMTRQDFNSKKEPL